MKPRKSSGIDQISINLINIKFETISTAKLHLFNVSLKNCKFTDSLKIAKIVPVYKNDDKGILSN